MKRLFLIICLLLMGCVSKKEKIHVYTRDSASGSKEAFVLGMDIQPNITIDGFEVSSNQDMIYKVSQDPYGIGYASYDSVKDNDELMMLPYKGVDANHQNILDGSYQLQRPFCFVTRAIDDYDSEKKRLLVAAFVDYLLYSQEGGEFIQGNGGIVTMDNRLKWVDLQTKHPITYEDNQDITIISVGSTSCSKIVEACFKDFSSRSGKVKFVLNHSGSSDAYLRLLGDEKDGANQGDIGFTSRYFKSEEQVKKAMNFGEFSKDAIVCIVAENCIKQHFRQNEIKMIFQGELKEFR